MNAKPTATSYVISFKTLFIKSMQYLAVTLHVSFTRCSEKQDFFVIICFELINLIELINLSETQKSLKLKSYRISHATI